MNIWTILEEAASAHGDSVALVDGDLRLTYRDVHRRSASLGEWLRRMGVSPGDRVAIAEVNSHRYLEAYYATARIGAVLTSINYRLSAPDVAFILDDSGAKVVLVNDRFEDRIPEGWRERPETIRLARGDGYERLLSSGDVPAPAVERGPDDLAHLYYTSGTTGKPKGVMLTHRNVRTHSEWAVDELGLRRDDVWGHIAPMFHLADAWAVFAVTMVGGRHVMVGQFEAGEVLDIIEGERVTTSNLIPTMLNLMTRHPDMKAKDLSSLRVILSGGAPIATEVVRRIMDGFGCDYVQTYGMTETSPYLTVSILPPHLDRLDPETRLRFKARTGRPFGGIELKVVGEDGSPVAANDDEVGEIWVRGPTVTPGYWNRPRETEEAFHDGWLKTGDLAVVDEDCFVNIVDRKKDMIITGGENVYSTEVEGALYEHEAIMEAAVFGVPDERWGEAVTAAVVLRPGHVVDDAELVAFMKGRLAGYKVPKRVIFLEELPRTGSGKIAKRVLRDDRTTGSDE